MNKLSVIRLRIGDALLCVAVALCALALVSCRDSGDDDLVNIPVNYDIMEVVSADPSRTVLNLWRPDADVPVVLTCDGANPLSSSANLPKPGNCALVAYSYINGRPYESGAVSIRSWAAINNLPLQTVKDGETADGWDSQPIEVWSIWRGGGHVFMRVGLPYSAEPRTFSLVIKPGTENDAVPTLLLWHERPAETPTFERRYYAAFNIAKLWDNPDVHGVRVLVANSLDPSQCEFTFMKKL